MEPLRRLRRPCRTGHRSQVAFFAKGCSPNILYHQDNAWDGRERPSSLGLADRRTAESVPDGNPQSPVERFLREMPYVFGSGRLNRAQGSCAR